MSNVPLTPEAFNNLGDTTNTQETVTPMAFNSLGEQNAALPAVDTTQNPAAAPTEPLASVPEPQTAPGFTLPPPTPPSPEIPQHPDLESMYGVAPQAKDHIDTIGESITAKLKAHPLAKAPIKGKKRAEEKIEEYKAKGGDHNNISDLVRNMVVLRHVEHFKDFEREAKKHGAYEVKEERADKNPAGYSGMLAKFKTPHGIKGEVQGNTPAMIAAKERESDARKMLGEWRYNRIAARFKKAGISLGDGHRLYEIIRDKKASLPDRMDALEESKRYYKKVREMEADWRKEIKVRTA